MLWNLDANEELTTDLVFRKRISAIFLTVLLIKHQQINSGAET